MNITYTTKNISSFLFQLNILYLQEIKNMRKNTPLTPEEIKELKAQEKKVKCVMIIFILK